MPNIYDVINLAVSELKWEDRIPADDQSKLHALSLLPPEDLNDFLPTCIQVGFFAPFKAILIKKLIRR